MYVCHNFAFRHLKISRFWFKRVCGYVAGIRMTRTVPTECSAMLELWDDTRRGFNDTMLYCIIVCCLISWWCWWWWLWWWLWWLYMMMIITAPPVQKSRWQRNALFKADMDMGPFFKPNPSWFRRIPRKQYGYLIQPNPP